MWIFFSQFKYKSYRCSGDIFVFVEEEKVSDHFRINWTYKVFNEPLNNYDKFTQYKPSCCCLLFLYINSLASCSQEALAHMLVEKFYLKLVVFQIKNDHCSVVSSNHTFCLKCIIKLLHEKLKPSKAETLLKQCFSVMVCSESLITGLETNS